MGLQTFLGPLLSGTQKNNNTVAVTSNTPSPTFLQAGTGNSYRNTGPNDSFQFITVPSSQWATAGTVFTPYYTVSGVNYPLCFPAGAYIDNIDLIVTTTFPATSFTMDIILTGAPNTTYSAGNVIATFTNASANPTPAGIYATSNSGSTASQFAPLVYGATAGGIAMIQNVGTSDAILQLRFNTAVPASGAFGLAFNYVVRNPDGSWYPQTPPVPFVNPSPATY